MGHWKDLYLLHCNNKKENTGSLGYTFKIPHTKCVRLVVFHDNCSTGLETFRGGIQYWKYAKLHHIGLYSHTETSCMFVCNKTCFIHNMKLMQLIIIYIYIYTYRNKHFLITHTKKKHVPGNQSQMRRLHHAFTAAKTIGATIHPSCRCPFHPFLFGDPYSSLQHQANIPNNPVPQCVSMRTKTTTSNRI